MEIGVSTACFYPLETEKSLTKTAELGFKTVELFINSPTELEKDFVKGLKQTKDEYNLNICSLHTYASFSESYYYFSSYPRRYYDSIEDFKRYFDATNTLGAKIIVMHGAKIPGSISDEEYCERFSNLIQLGKQQGVKVLQENVVHYRSESLDYIEIMKKNIGEDFRMVLDIKQSYRTKIDAFDFIDKHHDIIAHIHISDKNEINDCIPPLEGDFDFIKLFSTMKDYGYKGEYIIELYNHSFTYDYQIVNSAKNLKKLIIG